MRGHFHSLLIAAGLLMAVGVSVGHARQASETEHSREVVQRWFDFINRGDWRQAAELFAPDVQHLSGNWQSGTESIARGRTGLAGSLEDIFRTFPDWKMEIVNMVADGDSVAVRCRVSGTHKGVATRALNGGFLVGVPPTGKHFVVQHIHWFKVRNGLIVEHSAARDDLGMTQQLGLLPKPPSPPARK
jgi:steroid delta-isomerase-like uncharacterized protein